jgi:hypothetical protein
MHEIKHLGNPGLNQMKGSSEPGINAHKLLFGGNKFYFVYLKMSLTPSTQLRLAQTIQAVA